MLVEEEQLTLESLLTALERGNKLRISILPLGRTAFGGRLFLNRERIIHAHPYCDRMKVTTSGLEKCLACKSLATKKAVEGKEPFCSYCIHGAWEAVVPVIALAILVYVIYANVYPVPDFPFDVFPYVVAAWLVLGLGIVLFVPGLARRIGANLAEREGLADEESPRS